MRGTKAFAGLVALTCIGLMAGCGTSSNSEPDVTMDMDSASIPSTGGAESNTLVNSTDQTEDPATTDDNATEQSPTIETTPLDCDAGEEERDGTCIPTNADSTDISDEIIEKFVGTFAVQMKIVSMQEVPLIGQQESVSTVFAFVDVAVNDEGQLTMTERGCGASAATGETVKVTIPAAVAQSAESPTTPLTVWEEAGQLNWSRPTVVVPLGVRLDDPVNDALPSEPSDDRIYDQDGDGQPGITVNVTGIAEGDIYVIQKQVSSSYGTLTEEGVLEGFVVDNSEQVVIGSSNPLLNQQIPSSPHPDRSLSTFRSSRMNDDNDCAWLLDNAASLFP